MWREGDRMINLLYLYIGFTLGISFMDWYNIRDKHYLHLCKYSILHSALAILLSPITFPFYVAVLIFDRLKGI